MSPNYATKLAIKNKSIFRENLTVPKDGTLWTLQSSLKSGIELRLDPAFNAQQKLLEEEEERRRKKERERENREKRRKKREAKKKKLQEAKDDEKQTNSTDSGNVPDCPSSTMTQSVTDENKPDGSDLQTMDEDEDIDCIFAPKECLEDLDPHDRDVEIFKKFCLGKLPNIFLYRLARYYFIVAIIIAIKKILLQYYRD